MRLALTLLAVAAWAPLAVAQITVPVAELAQEANLVAVATVERVTETQGPTAPDRTLNVQLRLGQVVSGQPSSMTVIATLAETCYGGGGGPGHTCVLTTDMVGLTGLWLLKAGDSGYQIVPVERVTHTANGLFLPDVVPFGDPARPPDVDSLLLAYEVKWIQSLDKPAISEDLTIYSAFGPSIRARPNRRACARGDHAIAGVACTLAARDGAGDRAASGICRCDDSGGERDFHAAFESAI